jgi:hypothetical protein
MKVALRVDDLLPSCSTAAFFQAQKHGRVYDNVYHGVKHVTDCSIKNLSSTYQQQSVLSLSERKRSLLL